MEAWSPNPWTTRGFLSSPLGFAGGAVVKNFKKKEMVLLSDGENTYAEPMTADGAYGVLDYNKQTLTIYTADGEIALITRMDKNAVYPDSFYSCDDAYIVEVEVGGEYKSYIFAYGDQKIVDER